MVVDFWVQFVSCQERRAEDARKSSLEASQRNGEINQEALNLTEKFGVRMRASRLITPGELPRSWHREVSGRPLSLWCLLDVNKWTTERNGSKRSTRSGIDDILQGRQKNKTTTAWHTSHAVAVQFLCLAPVWPKRASNHVRTMQQNYVDKWLADQLVELKNKNHWLTE